MPSSISLHQLRLSVPSLSFLARRSLIVRSLFNLLASLSQPARRVKVLLVEEREFLEVKEVAVDHLAVDVVEDVAVEAVELVLAVE
jgi:hypothetical protein